MKTMMHLRSSARCALILLCVLALYGCRQHDLRTMTIDVPDAVTEKDAIVVRNMVNLELARQDASFRVELQKGLIWNGTRGRSLTRPEAGQTAEVLLGRGGGNATWVSERDLRRRIMTAFAEVGLNAEQVTVVPVDAQSASDAFQVIVKCSGIINDVRHANIAVAALATVMQGGPRPDITFDSATRSLTVTYDSLKLSLRNLEHAITVAGFHANDEPPDLAGAEPLRYGW